MSTGINYTTEEPKGPRCEERRRSVKRYRIPAIYESGDDYYKSNHPFTGMLIAATAKSLLPTLRRSIRSKYTPHVGTKQQSRLK
jgi:hypothetical protein